MSERPLEAVPDAGPPASELTDLYPVEKVRALFATFGKALRAFQLYDQNNPVYQRFVTALRDAIVDLWSEIDELTVAVQEERFLYEGIDVYEVSNRTESLAFLLYKDGIRELTFLPGVEDELERFLGVLQSGRKVRAEGDDLLTLLWEAELDHLKYFYVDLLADGVALPTPGGMPVQANLQEVLDGEMEDGKPVRVQGSPPATPEVVSAGDFNPTLYTLDPAEMDQVRREIQLEMARDVRRGVLDALFDRLSEPDRPARQSEILQVCSTLLPTLLSRGELVAATGLLAELRSIEARPGALDPERVAEVSELVDALSAGETIEELVRGLEDGSFAPTPSELGAFLAHLRAGALGPLLRATELTAKKELQPTLREAIEAIGSRHLRSLTGLLAHEDPLVVAGAARLVARLGVESAAGTLADLLGHASPDVRLAAIEGAVALRASTLAGGLSGALDDVERDVRVAAARALATLGYRPSAARFREILESKELREADLTEQITFFESYGVLAGEEGVPVLSKLLNGRGFLGRRVAPEIRACAALGLGKVGLPEATRALEAAAAADDPVVRSAVSRALRGEEDT